MEVKIKGTLPEDMPFDIACPNCKTVYAATQRDYVNSADKNAEIYKLSCVACKKTFEDTPENRLLAAELIKKENEKTIQENQKRKQAEIDKEIRTNSLSDYEEHFFGKPYNGGPTGPLPPPELDLLPCVKKVIKMAKQ